MPKGYKNIIIECYKCKNKDKTKIDMKGRNKSAGFIHKCLKCGYTQVIKVELIMKVNVFIYDSKYYYPELK